MDFVVCFFDTLHKAEEVRLALLKAEPDQLITLEDAVVAIRKPDGTLTWNTWKTIAHKEETDNPTGSITNLMFNSLSLTDLMLNGPPSDIRDHLANWPSECLLEMGITNTFQEKVIHTLKPGCSALFVASEKAKSERLLERIQKMGHETLRTSLQYDKFQAMLEQLKGT